VENAIAVTPGAALAIRRSATASLAEALQAIIGHVALHGVMPSPQMDLEALARFVSQKPATWQVLEPGSSQYAAWRDRLQAWLGVYVKPGRVWLEPFDEEAHTHGKSGYRPRKSTIGIYVPAPWPPRRDGSWSTEGEGA
jgi:hypothetical protein